MSPSLYILAGVLLTLVWLLVRGLAPAGGLTRSFHYPLAPTANPLRLDIARIPAAKERAADVDLAFLDELRRPTRHYFVRWRGVWLHEPLTALDVQIPQTVWILMGISTISTASLVGSSTAPVTPLTRGR